jgi:hypothetical protein
LLRSQEEVAVSSDSEVLAAFLFESAIYPTLTAERVEIVGVILAVTEGVDESPSWILFEVPPVAELELSIASGKLHMSSSR